MIDRLKAKGVILFLLIFQRILSKILALFGAYKQRHTEHICLIPLTPTPPRTNSPGPRIPCSRMGKWVEREDTGLYGSSCLLTITQNTIPTKSNSLKSLMRKTKSFFITIISALYVSG